MNPQETTVSRRVKAITNPRPQMVSLVHAGANQTPIKVTKADSATVQPGAMPTKEEIVRLTFKGAGFATQGIVEAWLAAGGYADTVIVQEGSAFVVTSKSDEGRDFGETVAIDMADGLTVEVCKAVATDDTPVVTETVTQKFDSWMAGWQGETTLDEGLESGFDGIPPGLRGVVDVWWTVLANCVIANNKPAIVLLCAELADMVGKMMDVFPNPTLETDTTEKAHDPAKMADIASFIVTALKAAKDKNDGPPITTLELDAVNLPVSPDAQPQGTGNGGSSPVGQPDVMQGRGTVDGGAVPNADGDTQVAQAEGTTSGGTTPEGDKKDQQSAGTASGGANPAGTADTRTVQPVGTTSGGANPASAADTRTVQKNRDTHMTELMGMVATLATSITTLGDRVNTLVTKSEEFERRLGADNGAQPTRKSADIGDIAAAGNPVITEVETEAMKAESYMAGVMLRGTLGLRRQ